MKTENCPVKNEHDWPIPEGYTSVTCGVCGFHKEPNQSPAVAVPEQKPAYYVNVPAGDPDGAHQFLKPAEWAKHFTRCLFEPLYRAPILQSPRITEQDVLPAGYREEWKRNVMLMWLCVRKHDSSIPSDVLDYMREQLLAKLNKPIVYVEHTATGDGSGSDSDNCMSFGEAFSDKPDGVGG